MAITVTGTLSATNIYLGELAMVKGGLSGPPPTGNNGTYAVQSFSGGLSTSTVNVTVPVGTAVCSPGGGCGTLFLGTPILGFASTSNAYNAAACFTGTCTGYGEHIKNLGFNCQNYDGCIGWQNLYAEEESGADTFLISNYNFVGFDIHGGPTNGSQNFGPVLNAEVLTGMGNTACAEGTTGAYIGDSEMRGVNGWTINNAQESGGAPACNQTPTAAVLLDAFNTEIRNGHCEGFLNCVVIGANNGNASGGQVSGISGGHNGNSGTNVVQISANYSTTNGKYLIERIRKNFNTNGIMDNINNVTLNDSFIALYSYAGIRAGAIRSGVAFNTDLAGQGQAQGPAISFSQTYTIAPICTCTDITGTAACRAVVTVGTPPTPTQITLTGTTGHTLNYICVGRN